MKFVVFLAIFASGALSFAEGGLRTASHSSVFHIETFKIGDMNCQSDQMRDVLAVGGKVLTRICQKQYRQCMFDGSCILEDSQGRRKALSYVKYDPVANQSYFSEVSHHDCSYGYGYGFGKVSNQLAGEVCLIPYFSAMADPVEHNLGDVIFIPALVGKKLPTGESHDGYIIISDYAKDYLGAGFDQYGFFTGNQSPSDQKNPFVQVGLADAGKIYHYSVVSGQKAEEVRQKRGFKVLRTFKRTFKVPVNPMLEPQN